MTYANPVKRNLLVAMLSLGAVACQTTRRDKVVEVHDDGKAATLQLSRDAKSTLAIDVAAEAKAAREALKSRQELSVALLSSIAELSLLSGDPKQAAGEARALLKKDLRNTDAMKTLIKVSVAQNRSEEAVLIAENAMAVQPRDADILCLKGLAQFMAGDALAARESWKKSLEINPAHVPAQMNLATLYYHNRNVQQAGAAFEKVLAMQPGNSDAQVGKALVLSAQGQAESARVLLADLLARAPKSGLVLYNLAVLEKEKFQNYQVAMDYTVRYLAVAKGDRKGTERFIAQREELKGLMARAQGPMSDSQLREMAATRSQSVKPGDGDESQAKSPLVSDAGQAAPDAPAASSAPAKGKGALDVNTDDAKSLEEAIK